MLDTIQPGAITQAQLARIKKVRAITTASNGNDSVLQLDSFTICYTSSYKLFSYIQAVKNDSLIPAEMRAYFLKVRRGDIILLGNLYIKGLKNNKYHVVSSPSWNVVDTGIAAVDCKDIIIGMDDMADETIDLPKLLRSSAISVKEKASKNSSLKLVSYTLEVKLMPRKFGEERAVHLFPKTGAAITSDIKETFKKLKPGDKITLKNIVFKKDGKSCSGCTKTISIR